MMPMIRNIIREVVVMFYSKWKVVLQFPKLHGPSGAKLLV